MEERRQSMGKARVAWSVILGASLLTAACAVTPTNQPAPAATAPAATSAAPTTAGQKTMVTFANWADAEPATKPQIEKVIAAFEQQNPDIQVVSQPVAFSDILQQDVVQSTAGNAPDVSQIAENDTMALAATGALQPLDQIAPASFLQTLYPNEVDLGKYQNSLIAMPWAVAPLGFWYNKTLMQQAGLDPAKPPATLDDFMADMNAIKAKEGDAGVVPFGLDDTNRAFGMDFNWPIMLTFGAQPIGDRANADTPQMQAYLQFIRTVNQSGLTLPGKKLGEFRPLAAQNKLAFAFDGPYLQGTMLSTDTSLTNQKLYDTWGVTVFPAGPDGKHYSMPTDHQLVMFKTAKDKQAAWKFMQYLISNKEAIEDYTIASGTLPPTSDAATQFPDQMNTPIAQAYLKDVIPTVVRPPWGPVYAKAIQPVMAAVQEAASGDTAIPDITKNLQSQLQPLFQQ
jgi:multiple sugar transport system substrate-binding protein